MNSSQKNVDAPSPVRKKAKNAASRGNKYSASDAPRQPMLALSAPPRISGDELLDQYKKACKNKCLLKKYQDGDCIDYAAVIQHLRNGESQTYGMNSAQFQTFLFDRFKETVQNPPALRTGPTVGKFKHSFRFPECSRKLGEEHVDLGIDCRDCWRGYYRFSVYYLEQCSKTLKSDWSLCCNVTTQPTRGAQRYTYDEAASIIENNVVREDTNTLVLNAGTDRTF